MSETARPQSPAKERAVALVLQGGGALGAFQVGAYEALCTQKLRPCWIAGTSIGAINGAIIAGNEPNKALERLHDFWYSVSTPDAAAPPEKNDSLRQIFSFWSAQQSVFTGQPGFFTPRPVPPVLAPPGGPAATSFYDTNPLKLTLERLIDFDRINARACRLSLGAVEVDTGRQVYFDNHIQKIGPEHVMASGALPPAFPAVRVGDKLYWDGGIVSNTPLDALMSNPPTSDLLILVVDLWNPRGRTPATMIEVQARLKDITYASRAMHHIDAYEKISVLRQLVDKLYKKLPAGPDADALWFEVESLGCPHVVDIVHLIYEEASYELPSRDYEFSRSSVARHREQGLCQAMRVLARRGWCTPSTQPDAVRIHETPPLPLSRRRAANTGRRPGRRGKAPGMEVH
ncbi:MAG TPA: patatin-like phospholipase family protein [Alphaproteobacteria bacterium]|nr:patatin-like phospholipase family protein [Alphaproteobacteria bacterium]